MAEHFARGLLPHPDALLPPAKHTDDCETCWHNRPPDGRLSGTLFLDGSGMGGHCAALRRAGWAIVQVDRFGDLIAAAFGPVPWDACPGQTSRDGEDYAVSMLPFVALEPFELFIDCKGTLDTISSPQSRSAGARGPRANLWSRVWSSFNELRAHKTKAHATLLDVERGLSTEWERKANNFADGFAKQGAALHGLSADIELQYRSLASLAFQAARWAAEQAVRLRRSGAQDSARLPEKGCHSVSRPHSPKLSFAKTARRCKIRCLQSVLKESLAYSRPNSSSAKFLGHSLRVAEVSFKGVVLFCASCGAYAWASPRALLAPCPGRERSPARAAQRARLARLEYPSGHHGQWRLSSPRPPAPTVLAFLAEVVARRPRAEEWQSAPASPMARTSLSRAKLLERYGLTEASFSALVERTQQAEEAGEPELFLCESDSDWSQSSA